MAYSIIPIVEGFSEVEAIPVLLRRLLTLCNCTQITIGEPVRVKRNLVTKVGEVEKSVRYARLKEDCAAVMIFLDADDDCPKELGPELRSRADSVAGGIPVSVVLANRETEAWFLASITSLRGMRGISSTATAPQLPEQVRGAKEYLSRWMGPGRSYIEVDDQPAFMDVFDMRIAHDACRSFRKVYSDFGKIVSALTGLDCPPSL